MEDARQRNVFDELLVRLQCPSYPKLAQALDISSQAVYGAKKNGTIPRTWVEAIKNRFGIDITDLIENFSNSDCTQIYQDEKMGDDNYYQSDIVSRLLVQLEQETQERRDLYAENRQLLRENGELRLQIETLKAKLAKLAPPTSEDGEQRTAQSA